MKLGFLPGLKDGQRAWLNNFVTKLEGAGNAYVAKYNIPAATVTALTQGRLWVEWVFNNLGTLRTKTQSLTQFQNQLMNGKGATGDLSLPEVPTYTDFPGGNTTPITPVADVIGFAAGIAKQIKQKSNYSEADGEDLGIEGPEQPPLPPMESTAPDLTKTRHASAGQVEVVWRKERFDGIRIEVIRLLAGDTGTGTETWQFLAIDTEPNYIDTVAPAPGTVAIHKYRAIYLLDDQPYGQWSQTVEVTVRG